MHAWEFVGEAALSDSDFERYSGLAIRKVLENIRKRSLQKPDGATILTI